MSMRRHTELGWLALFTSTGTLICCALPILLVTLGLGAVVASLTSRFPVLITLSEYHGWMFGISAVFLCLTGWVIWGREQRCPADPVLAARCVRSMRWNRRIFWGTAVVWTVGFTAAFLLLPIRNALGI